MITVVAALIRDNDRVLICQRRESDSFPLKWEFPGGKVHEGESPEEALARELREELDISAKIGREIYRTRYRYVEYTDEIELIFFAAEAHPPSVRNLAFAQILWADMATLPDIDFLAADREFVAQMAAGALRLL